MLDKITPHLLAIGIDVERKLSYLPATLNTPL